MFNYSTTIFDILYCFMDSNKLLDIYYSQFRKYNIGNNYPYYNFIFKKINYHE